jgi:small subunit ribosomal protein S9
MPEKKKTTTKKTVKTDTAKKDVKSKPKADEKEKAPSGEYIQTVGRRKTSIAQVRLYKNGKGKIIVNDHEYKDYFPVINLQQKITDPLKQVGQENKFDISVKVSGGGIRGQADAVCLGISRALVETNPTFKKALKKMGYMTRDPRKKERKKPGLKGARRAPQWSKR